MSFEDLTFSYSIGIGYIGANLEDTLRVSDYFTEEDWFNMTDKEKDAWLDKYLETEMANHLDANIWIDD